MPENCDFEENPADLRLPEAEMGPSLHLDALETRQREIAGLLRRSMGKRL